MTEVVLKEKEGLSNSLPRQNYHPTVKPLKLMEYLIKLIMPPKGGVLLDPFAGSGTTILAAHRLGISAIGIEMSAEYCEIARARINHSVEKAKEAPEQMVFV
jgi:site-specific DNA-methyltransferase (adenine-specific)